MCDFCGFAKKHVNQVLCVCVFPSISSATLGAHTTDFTHKPYMYIFVCSEYIYAYKCPVVKRLVFVLAAVTSVIHQAVTASYVSI